MRKLTLGDKFSEKQQVKINSKGDTEAVTRFYIETMGIINSGQLPYRDMAHYKVVRKAVKQFQSQKKDPEILLEDSDFRTLFGTDSEPGFLRGFGGWMSFDDTDEYIEIWESAKQESIAKTKKERSDEKV